MHILMNTHMHVHRCTPMHTLMSTHTGTHMYTCTGTLVHVHACVYTHIHAHRLLYHREKIFLSYKWNYLNKYPKGEIMYFDASTFL